MPDAQTRNASMQNLNSADLLYAKDRNISISMYGAVGGPIFNAAATVQLEEIRYNQAEEIFDLDTDILTITGNGLFLFLFTIGVYDYLSTGNASATAWLEEDPATAVWSSVPGTLLYAPFFSGDRVSLSGHALLFVQEGYRYRLRTARNSGSGNLAVGNNSSSLSVILLSSAG